MTLELQQCEELWQAAEKLLKAAQELRAGPERIDALKAAGQLRYKADQHRRVIQRCLAVTPNQSIERTCPGVPGHVAHVKR